MAEGMDMVDRSQRNSVIRAFVKEGCNSSEIKFLLYHILGVKLSVRQIQRICQRKNASLIDIEKAIINELKGSGSLLGYRSMWQRLKHKYKYSVPRDTVMVVLGLLDSVRTAERKARRLKRRVYRNKGPNFTWHCDGNDKLKKYGFPIHGCIDGYSRKILWLKLLPSNNNPKYIASCFLKCVDDIEGCPRVLRTDMGSENSLIAVFQPLLRHAHMDGNSGSNSHHYGRSTFNQTLSFHGYYNPSISFHQDSARFTFGEIIQKELDVFTCSWNCHYIQQSKMAEAPGGVPNVLYNFPQLKGKLDYACPVESYAYTQIKQYCLDPVLVSTDFKRLAESIMLQYNIAPPSTFKQALECFFILITVIDFYL